MYIVMVTPECSPVTQAGGLGEVIFGLSRELELRGNAVDIILPRYDCLRYDQIHSFTVAYEHLAVPWYSGFVDTTVWFGFVHGRRCYFIDPHSPDAFFNRGRIYGCADDVMRFGFFSKAALEFMLKTNRRPDVIHCHDWPTALVPVLLYEIYQHTGMHRQRVCFTIHNFAHQGVSGEKVLWAVGIVPPGRVLGPDRLGGVSPPGTVNLLKGAIVYANFVTTVSPHHAWEAMYTDQGRGMSHTLYLHRRKFGGVLNGVDYDVWNPEVDRFLPERYMISNLDHKYANKVALRDRFLLQHSYKPIVAYVGRLDQQKGVELIHHAIFHSLAHGAQFVLMGQGSDAAMNGHFSHLKWYLKDSGNCHLEIGWDERLAHLIFAGADLVLVPSLFEPCGLPQMIAMKYGTVPIVRAVGGLLDTVFDVQHSDRPFHERNGFVFHQADHQAVESALERALGLWNLFPEVFHELMVNGMSSDHSWARPGQYYLDIYDHIRDK